MATRVQHKRSSLLGKRPAEQYLEPGEIALNTNQDDPGLFFETNTGDIAKVGPTAIGTRPPQTQIGYGPGETWYDTGNGTLNIYVPALGKWVATQSPLFGANTTVIFVGSEFPEASDDLSNDGIARPFATLNRAVIEVARRSILSGREDEAFNGRFTILLLPGRNIAYNEPGVTLSDFEEQVTGFTEDQEITQSTLRLFNPVTGGLLVPRGTSIVGLDLRKTILAPTYYPFWSRKMFEEEPADIAPRTSVLKWTGNSYFTSMTFNQKVGVASIVEISGEADDPAVLTSLRPHGYRTLISSSASPEEIEAADVVRLTYPDGVSRLYNNLPTLPEDDYFVEPLTPTTFRLRKVISGELVTRKDLPQAPVPGSSPANYLTLTFILTTHHRLSALSFATAVELNEMYAKVQRAFSLLSFGGTVNNAEVAPGETTIVALTPQPPDVSVNTISNASPYIFNCSLRSEYGMSGVEVDGSKVEGFKSALLCNFTSVSLQNDSEVYEVYDGQGENPTNAWISLKQAYANYAEVEVQTVTDAQAMEFLTSGNVNVDDVRFFIRPANDIPGQDGKSSGLISELSDTRHYALEALNGAYAQTVASFAIGIAVNYWAKSGAQISVTNANSNFGGVALRAEGFAGIGTRGGAQPPDKGFIVKAVRRPALITPQMVEDSNNIKRFYLNARISSTTATTLTFDTEIDTSVILPYTLRPGTYLWVENISTGDVYGAQLASADVLSSNKLTLSIQDGANGIQGAIDAGVSISDLSLAFVRRFVDPRSAIDKQYSLWLNVTGSEHRAPQVGSVLRYAAESPNNFLRPGVQLDPGLNGGWNHVFQVVDTRTKKEGDNPNGAEPLIVPTISANDYYVTFSAVDSFHPWVTVGNNGFDSATDINYSRGNYSTYQQRIFYAQENDEGAASLKPLPTASQITPWTRAKSFEYCQPTAEAWLHASGFTSADDTLEAVYTPGSTYARGVQYNTGTTDFNNVVDIDDGTSTLGLLNGGVVQTDLYDPWWHPTKAAMTRFLSLLGFEYSDIDTMLTPQLWTSRNLLVGSMPEVGTTGYAYSTDEWPVEFNLASTIRCGNHTWEWCGYIDYSKGLSKYQKSQLSLRQRFDFISTETWGGIVYATGQNEKGEFILTNKTVAGGTGATVLEAGAGLVQYPPQNVLG
jgi:hypothetical protein